MSTIELMMKYYQESSKRLKKQISLKQLLVGWRLVPLNVISLYSPVDMHCLRNLVTTKSNDNEGDEYDGDSLANRRDGCGNQRFPVPCFRRNEHKGVVLDQSTMDRLYLEFPRMGDVQIECGGVQDECEVFVVRGMST